MPKGHKSFFKRVTAVLTAICILTVSSLSVQAQEPQFKAIEEKTLFSLPSSYNKSLDAVFADAWSNYKTLIDISKYKVKASEFSDVYNYVSEILPEYFYLDFGNTYYSSNSSGYVVDVKIGYLYTASVRNSQRKLFDAAVDAVLDKAKGITSQEDKVVFFHDYIANHNKYDTVALIDAELVDDYSFTAYGFFINHVSVCQGMSDAFVLLCNKSGITARVVSSIPMVHAWNIVEINGQYYHLDITWNDNPNGAGLAYDGKSEDFDFLDVKGFSSHKYFMKSDTQFTELEHYNWETEFSGTDSVTYNNYYWQDVYSNIYYIKGSQYYMKNSSLIKRNPKTGNETVLYTVKNSSFSANGKKYVWYSRNTVLAYDFKHNFLLMNLSDGVYAFNLSNLQTTKVLNYTSDGYIAGIAFNDDGFVYDVADVDGSNGLYQISDLSAEIEFPEYSVLYGDADNNNSFNITDILKLKKYAANIETDINEFNCDVNEDNIVDAKDILLLSKSMVNSDITFGG